MLSRVIFCYCSVKSVCLVYSEAYILFSNWCLNLWRSETACRYLRPSFKFLHHTDCKLLQSFVPFSAYWLPPTRLNLAASNRVLCYTFTSEIWLLIFSFQLFIYVLKKYAMWQLPEHLNLVICPEACECEELLHSFAWHLLSWNLHLSWEETWSAELQKAASDCQEMSTEFPVICHADVFLWCLFSLWSLNIS